MAKMENAENCFKRLLQESTSQKFHKSLERVKKACDTIEDMKGLLNYSRVAQYTENHYGSPKRQSIMNSKRLRLYIDLRKQEYTEKQPEKKHPQQKILLPNTLALIWTSRQRSILINYGQEMHSWKNPCNRCRRKYCRKPDAIP